METEEIIVNDLELIRQVEKQIEERHGESLERAKDELEKILAELKKKVDPEDKVRCYFDLDYPARLKRKVRQLDEG